MYCQNVCTGEAVIYILLLLKLSEILTLELTNSHRYLSVEECVMAHREEYLTVEQNVMAHTVQYLTV